MRWMAVPLAVLVLTGCSTTAGVATPDRSQGADGPGVSGRSTGTFDPKALERNVSRMLTAPAPDGFGLADVSDVTCPAGVAVEAGGTFACAVQINGEDREVGIVITDDSGVYEVGFPAPKDTDPPAGGVFDHESVQRDVEKILTDTVPKGFGLSGVSAVTCPEGVDVRAGGTFECAVMIDGEPKSVEVTIVDVEGTYEVGYPG